MELVANNGPQLCDLCKKEETVRNEELGREQARHGKSSSHQNESKASSGGSSSSRHETSQGSHEIPTKDMGAWCVNRELRQNERMITNPITKDEHRHVFFAQMKIGNVDLKSGQRRLEGYDTTFINMVF